MQKSTQLRISGILTAAGSCITLASALFMILFTWLEYFVPYHYGIRGISEPFYVQIAIIIFEISAFVLGPISASNTLKRRKLSLSLLGTNFLLIAGLLFFTSLIYNILPHVETLGVYITVLQPYCGIPLIILAAISIILLVLRKKEFNNKESNPLMTIKAILILSSIISALFAFLSIVNLERIGFQFASSYALSTLIVSLCTFLFATLAVVILLKKNNIYALIVLTVLSLLSALSLSFIFMFIYSWIGTFVKGLVTESPIIVLSAVALVLEFWIVRMLKT